MQQVCINEKCRKPLSVSAELAGQQVQCPACGQVQVALNLDLAEPPTRPDSGGLGGGHTQISGAGEARVLKGFVKPGDKERGIVTIPVALRRNPGNPLPQQELRDRASRAVQAVDAQWNKDVFEVNIIEINEAQQFVQLTVRANFASRDEAIQMVADLKKAFGDVQPWSPGSRPAVPAPPTNVPATPPVAPPAAREDAAPAKKGFHWPLGRKTPHAPAASSTPPAPGSAGNAAPASRPAPATPPSTMTVTPSNAASGALNFKAVAAPTSIVVWLRSAEAINRIGDAYARWMCVQILRGIEVRTTGTQLQWEVKPENFLFDSSPQSFPDAARSAAARSGFALGELFMDGDIAFFPVGYQPSAPAPFLTTLPPPTSEVRKVPGPTDFNIWFRGNQPDAHALSYWRELLAKWTALERLNGFDVTFDFSRNLNFNAAVHPTLADPTDRAFRTGVSHLVAQQGGNPQDILFEGNVAIWPLRFR